MPKVTKDTIIADVLRMNRGTAMVFLRHGLHCLGWGGVSMESIGDAAMVHGIDVDALLKDLNDYIEQNS